MTSRFLPNGFMAKRCLFAVPTNGQQLATEPFGKNVTPFLNDASHSAIVSSLYMSLNEWITGSLKILIIVHFIKRCAFDLQWNNGILISIL